MYHQNLPDLLKTMILSLDEAIADAEFATEHYEAWNGQLLSSSGSSNRYEFTLKTPWEPEENTRVNIKIDPEGSHPLSGRIVAVSGMSIIIATEDLLPVRAMEHITLYGEATWLLPRLRESVQALESRDQRELLLAAKTFGFLSSVQGRGKIPKKIGTFLPDSDQRLTIERGLVSEITRLVGPPGTGKTSTLAPLALFQATRKHASVLILSHTNIAVDNAVMRLKEFFYETGNDHLLVAHKIVRFGDPKHPDLLTAPYQDMTVALIADQENEFLAAEREDLQRQQLTLPASIEQLQHALERNRKMWQSKRRSIEQRLASLKKELEQLEAAEERSKATIARGIKEEMARRSAAQVELALLVAEERHLTALRAQWEAEKERRKNLWQAATEEQATVQKMGRIRRYFSSYRDYDLATRSAESAELFATIGRAEQQITKIDYRLHEIVLSRIPFQVAIEKVTAELVRLQEPHIFFPDQITMLRGRYATNRAHLEEIDRQEGEAEEKIKQQQYQLDRCAVRLGEIKTQISTTKQHILAEAQVVATTLTMLMVTPALLHRAFDVVIIDEASMAPLALVLVAASCATRHVVVVGDPTQLAPISTLHHPEQASHASKWLAMDLFTYVGITLKRAEQGEDYCVLLRQQSRMDRAISAPISAFVYGGALIDRNPDRVSPKMGPGPAYPFLLIDTSDASEQECFTQKPEGRSRYNAYHIRCDLAIARQLLATLPPAPPSFVGGPRIGIVTPYRAQANRIKRELRKEDLLHLIHVGTVHTFQSLEFEAMIFDTVDASRVGLSSFTSDRIWDQQGGATQATRLLNVAHTRAKYKLVYVAHVRWINKQPHRKDYLLNKLVIWPYERGWFLNSQEVLGLPQSSTAEST